MWEWRLIKVSSRALAAASGFSPNLCRRLRGSLIFDDVHIPTAYAVGYEDAAACAAEILSSILYVPRHVKQKHLAIHAAALLFFFRGMNDALPTFPLPCKYKHSGSTPHAIE